MFKVGLGVVYARWKGLYKYYNARLSEFGACCLYIDQRKKRAQLTKKWLCISQFFFSAKSRGLFSRCTIELIAKLYVYTSIYCFQKIR